MVDRRSRRRLGRQRRPLRGGGVGERLAQPRDDVSTRTLAARLGVDEGQLADVGQLGARAGRRSRPRGREWRAASRPAAGASRAGRGSRRRGRRAPARGAAAPARRRASAGDVAPTPSSAGSRPGSRGAGRAAPARPAAGGRRRSREPPNVTIPSRLPRWVARWPIASGDALGDVGLAPVGGPERHRRRDVEQEPGRERPLGDVDADVRHGRCARSRSSRSGGRRRPARTAAPGRAPARAGAEAERWSPARSPSIRRRARQVERPQRGGRERARAGPGGRAGAARRRGEAERLVTRRLRPPISSRGAGTTREAPRRGSCRRDLLGERLVAEHEPVAERVRRERRPRRRGST